MTHLVVDAMNVIGSRPTGWWRDRDEAVRKLARRLRVLARDFDGRVTLIADGRPLRDLPEGMYGPLEVLYARRRGPNAADDRITEFVRDHADPQSIEVVTSDRALKERVMALGGRISGPQALLERLDAMDA